MEYPLNQSAWRRGWNDTKTTWTSWQFYVLDAVVAVVIGGLFQWYWGLVIVAFGMFCVWLGATASAPIRQRNEARNLLSTKPNKRQFITDKLTEFYLSGVKLRQSLIKKELGNKSVERYEEWILPMLEFFRASPVELGESRIAYFAIPTYKETDIPNFAQLDNESYSIHLLIESQLVKIMELIKDFQK